VILRIDTTIIGLFIDVYPVGFVDSSPVAGGWTIWEGRCDLDPSALASSDRSYLIGYLREVLVLAEYQSDVTNISKDQAHDIESDADIESNRALGDRLLPGHPRIITPPRPFGELDGGQILPTSISLSVPVASPNAKRYQPRRTHRSLDHEFKTNIFSRLYPRCAGPLQMWKISSVPRLRASSSERLVADVGAE
jgi:hypothetical protein